MNENDSSRQEKEQETKVSNACMGRGNSMGDFLIVTHTGNAQEHDPGVYVRSTQVESRGMLG